MPEFKLPDVDIEKAAAELNNAVKEAAYVVVGLGVLGFQRAQVRRVELTKLLESQLAGLADASAQLGTQAESYFEAARAQLTEAQARLAKLSESVIPSLPSEVTDSAAVREQLAALAKSVDEAVAPVRQQFEEQLDRVEEVLPQTARDLVQTVRAAAAAQEQTIRSVVGLS